MVVGVESRGRVPRGHRDLTNLPPKKNRGPVRAPVFFPLRSVWQSLVRLRPRLLPHRFEPPAELQVEAPPGRAAGDFLNPLPVQALEPAQFPGGDDQVSGFRHLPLVGHGGISSSPPFGGGRIEVRGEIPCRDPLFYANSPAHDRRSISAAYAW